MVERALLFALVALAVVLGASAIADAFKHNAKTMECAFERATVCIYDKKQG